MSELRCLSAVMPCYNEESTVAEVLELVLASPYIAEVLVIDDGSTDHSVEIVERIAAADDRLRLLRQPFNMGKGAALQRGCLEVSQPFVVLQDADVVCDPTDFEKLMGPLLDGRADIVFGSRFRGGVNRTLPFWHAVSSRILTLAGSKTSHLDLTDVEIGPKAFRREVLESFTLEEARSGTEPEMAVKMAAAGWRVCQVGISYSGHPNSAGKKFGLREALRTAWCVLRYSRLGERWARSRARRAGPELEPDDYAAGLEPTLQTLDQCTNYPDWLSGLILPHLRGRVHEVGAGTGAIALRLAQHGELVVSEPDPSFATALRMTFENQPVTVVEANLDVAVSEVDADTIVLVNVLEHLEHDSESLETIFQNLPAGGRLVLFVPALEMLYSPTDRRMGHYRRYSRAGLVNLLSGAGFHVLDAQYVNMLGAVLWFGYARVLGRHPTEDASAGLYDRFMVKAMSRWEAGRQVRFGQSVIAVAERP